MCDVMLDGGDIPTNNVSNNQERLEKLKSGRSFATAVGGALLTVAGTLVGCRR